LLLRESGVAAERFDHKHLVALVGRGVGVDKHHTGGWCRLDAMGVRKGIKRCWNKSARSMKQANPWLVSTGVHSNDPPPGGL